MKLNAAGLNVSGPNNPNWKGGLLEKCCEVCSKKYQVKRSHASSRYCSMACVGISQRGARVVAVGSKRVMKTCEWCGTEFSIFRSHADRTRCCSKACSYKWRSRVMKGSLNPNWSGGISRLPYPWDFREKSRAVIARDGYQCMNPECTGKDQRLTTHHINYEKQDCRQENLICLCSSCNSKANFGREEWQRLYSKIIAERTK